jgi:hypothetical protein
MAQAVSLTYAEPSVICAMVCMSEIGNITGGARHASMLSQIRSTAQASKHADLA